MKILFKTFIINRINFHTAISGNIIADIETTELFKILKSALSNLVDLAKSVLNTHIKNKIFVKIKFCEIENLYGQFIYDSKTIKINNVLIFNKKELEKTIFHELIHYFFCDSFELEEYDSLFSESSARYFENHYYPDYNIKYAVFKDRNDNNIYAPGFYILDYLHKNCIKTLKLSLNKPYNNQKIYEIQRKIINEFYDIEYSIILNLFSSLMTQLDFVLIDKNDPFPLDGYGLIYRSRQMNQPLISYLPPDYFIKFVTLKTQILKMKIPDFFSKDFAFSDLPEDVYEFAATLYANESKKMSEINYRVLNQMLF